MEFGLPDHSMQPFGGGQFRLKLLPDRTIAAGAFGQMHGFVGAGK